MFLEQRGVADVIEMGVEATLRLVGIGTIGADASILSTGLVERDEFEEARRPAASAKCSATCFRREAK